MAKVKKSFRDHLGPEDLLHEACLRWCDRKLPGVPVIHVPNEGKRSHFEAFKFEVLGGKAGVSDLFLPHTSGTQKGIWIELKHGRNKMTPDQLEFLVKMYYQGYAVAVVWDKVEDFELLMNTYDRDPAFFTGGIVVAKGDLTVFKFEAAKEKLVKQVSEKSRVRKATNDFEKKAKARFGKPLQGVKLPNAGKLFKSPLNKKVDS